MLTIDIKRPVIVWIRGRRVEYNASLTAPFYEILVAAKWKGVREAPDRPYWVTTDDSRCTGGSGFNHSLKHTAEVRWTHQQVLNTCRGDKNFDFMGVEVAVPDPYHVYDDDWDDDDYYNDGY